MKYKSILYRKSDCPMQRSQQWIKDVSTICMTSKDIKHFQNTLWHQNFLSMSFCCF